MRGTKTGPDNASAALVDGATADRNSPNETAQLATRITTRQQIRNFPPSLFRFVIQ